MIQEKQLRIIDTMNTADYLIFFCSFLSLYLISVVLSYGFNLLFGSSVSPFLEGFIFIALIGFLFFRNIYKKKATEINQ